MTNALRTGLDACREGLASDKWLYGMTPRFSVARTLPLGGHAAARVNVQVSTVDRYYRCGMDR